MSTFLFVSMPIPAHTTNPMPFAARLVERGHRVLWLAGRSFHERLATTGAQPFTYVESPDLHGTTLEEAFPNIAASNGVQGIRLGFAEIFVGMADRRVRDIQRVLAAHRVDATLTDGISCGPGLVHELGGPPWATFGDGPLPFEDRDTPPFGPGLLPMPGRIGRLRNDLVRTIGQRLIFGPAQRRLDTIRRDLGLPAGPAVLDALSSPLLHLQGCMPGFDYPMAEPPGHVHWVGPLRPDPMAWHEPDWWARVVESHRPMVFVSQGSIRPDVTELLVPTVHALADFDGHVVVVTGQAAPADVLRAYGAALPANTFVTDFIPYDLALARADCFVTRGGYTGVTLALAHGTPMVQAGTTEEKSEIGARIQWSGVGVRLGTTRPKPEAVQAAVGRVFTEPSFVGAARRLEAEAVNLDAGRMGAALLERLASTARSVLREAAPSVISERQPP